MSFHATKLKQEDCELEIIQIPWHGNLCSNSLGLDNKKIEVLDFFIIIIILILRDLPSKKDKVNKSWGHYLVWKRSCNISTLGCSKLKFTIITVSIRFQRDEWVTKLRREFLSFSLLLGREISEKNINLLIHTYLLVICLLCWLLIL